MCDAPTPPPAPAPIDPSESGLDYLRGMIQLQPQLLAAEQQYRPQYNMLNLQDAGRTLLGSGYDQYRQDTASPGQMFPIENAPGSSGLSGLSPTNVPSPYGGGGQQNGGASGQGFDTLMDPSLQDPYFSGPGAFSTTQTAVAPTFQTPNQDILANYPEGAYIEGGSVVVPGELNTPGALELADIAGKRLEETRADIATSQRTSDIEDVEALGSRASEAFLNANPRLKEALDEAESLTGPTENDDINFLRDRLRADQSDLTQTLESRAQQLAESEGALTPFERLALEEQSRSAAVGRGRGLDNSGIADELSTRIEAQRGRKLQDLAMAQQLNQQVLQDRQFTTSGLGSLAQLTQQQQAQDRQYGLNYANLAGSAASDPFQAILNRPGTAFGAGQAQVGQSQSLVGQATPQLFNPDTGINLALAQQANQGNYLSNIYGAQAGYKGSVIGGGLSAIGSIFGGMG